MPAITPNPCAWADTELFHDLNSEQLAWLEKRLHRKTFAANVDIFTTDQTADVVYIICSGTVKIHSMQTDGRDAIVSILGAGDTVGEMGVFDGAHRSADVTTLEESVLMRMDRADFQECLRTMPSVTYNMVRIVSARLRLANEQIQSLAMLNVYGRIARQMLAFAHKYGKRASNGDVVIPIRLTQGDIADLVGASRKRVNQVMVTYKRRGLLSVDDASRITIHDEAGLATYCA